MDFSGRFTDMHYNETCSITLVNNFFMYSNSCANSDGTWRKSVQRSVHSAIGSFSETKSGLLGWFKWRPTLILQLFINPARSGPGLWNHFLFLSSACSFCISTSLPMQFVRKRAQKSTNIVLGCEVVRTTSHNLPRTTSLPVDFVQKLAYNWLLRFCGLRPG